MSEQKLHIKQWISRLFRKPNGDADVWATMTILATLGMIGSQIFALYKGQAFDAQGFGIGFGALLGAAAAGLGFKAKGENGHDKPNGGNPQ